MSKTCPVCGKELQHDEITCEACGFKFLEATQKFHPVSLSTEDAVTIAEKPKASVALRIIRGPQIETVFHLENDEFTVGRSPKCDIFLNDMTVSRDHAVIRKTLEGFVIEDKNSFNGIWIDNKNIDKALLEKGNIIQIGAFCLLYQEE